MKALAWMALCFPALASASAIDLLHSFTAQTQTARAHFAQTVYDKAGRKLQESSGEFELQRPGKFRWSYLKPNAQIIVGDGRRVWTYDEDLNQVTVRHFDKVLGSTPAALLAGTQDIEEAFDLSEQAATDGLSWVSATPKAKDTGVAGIRLGFRAGTLARLELDDPFGQRTVIRIDTLEKNPKLGAEVFRFTPPRGADVLGD